MSGEQVPHSSLNPDVFVGCCIAGRYELEKLIGRGSTSMVFQARHVGLGSAVAIKMLSPVGMSLDAAMHDRFQFEAQVLADLRHPNIVNVFDLGSTDDGFRYMAMELLRGETLQARLNREQRLTPEAAVRVIRETAEALTALHERGLVHRDVKPANVFVVRDSAHYEAIKLMDFGLARALNSAAFFTGGPDDEPGSENGPRRRLRTEQGLVLGTAAYMSPELIQGQDLDVRSDVYALGVIAYRMLTGSLPFSGQDLPRLLCRHVCEPVEPLRVRAPDAEISVELDLAVLRALEKRPEQRPESARAFACQLEAALESSLVTPASVAPEVVAPPEPSLAVDVDSARPLWIDQPAPDAPVEASDAPEEAAAPFASEALLRRRRGIRRTLAAVLAPATLLAAYGLVAHRRIPADGAPVASPVPAHVASQPPAVAPEPPEPAEPAPETAAEAAQQAPKQPSPAATTRRELRTEGERGSTGKRRRAGPAAPAVASVAPPAITATAEVPPATTAKRLRADDFKAPTWK